MTFFCGFFRNAAISPESVVTGKESSEVEKSIKSNPEPIDSSEQTGKKAKRSLLCVSHSESVLDSSSSEGSKTNVVFVFNASSIQRAVRVLPVHRP